MKLSILLATTALAAALSPLAAQAQSPNDLVRIEVKVATEVPHSDVKAKPGEVLPQTHEKTLQIAISGKPKTPETRTGHWAVYGKSGKDLTAVESADFKLELPVTGQQKVETKKATLTFTPEHSAGGGGGGKGKAAPAAKKVAATGMKYAGYGVVIKDGDKVVGEAYDPVGLKAEIAK